MPCSEPSAASVWGAAKGVPGRTGASGTGASGFSTGAQEAAEASSRRAAA